MLVLQKTELSDGIKTVLTNLKIVLDHIIVWWQRKRYRHDNKFIDCPWLFIAPSHHCRSIWRLHMEYDLIWVWWMIKICMITNHKEYLPICVSITEAIKNYLRERIWHFVPQSTMLFQISTQWLQCQRLHPNESQLLHLATCCIAWRHCTLDPVQCFTDVCSAANFPS